jgi:hypothetical protein
MLAVSISCSFVLISFILLSWYRDELAGLQEQAKAREQELKHEIDRLRKRGGEDGASQSGTNASTEQSTQIISLEHKVQELTDSLASEKKLHKKELMDLNRRVEWYIENQELVDAHAAQLKAQADEIKRLTDVARENCPQCTHNAKKLKVRPKGCMTCTA